MLAILFFFVFLEYSYALCPEGSVVVNNPPGTDTKWKCILIDPFEMDFSSAESRCKNKKGHLVSIDNKGIDFYIARELLYVIAK